MLWIHTIWIVYSIKSQQVWMGWHCLPRISLVNENEESYNLFIKVLKYTTQIIDPRLVK